MSAAQFLDPSSQDAADLRRIVQLRSKNRIAVLTDSRGAQLHADTTKNIRAGYNHRTFGDTLAGRRTIMAGNMGVSGDRTDQILARLVAALLTKCGTLDYQGGANDIAQSTTGFVSLAGPMAGVTINAANVVAHILGNAETCILASIEAGVQNFILTLETGAGNMSATQVGNVILLNQGYRELAEKYPNVVVFDLPAFLWNPTASGSGAIVMVTGAVLSESGSFIHEANLGAQLAGVGYANLLKQIMPEFPRMLRSNAEQNAAANKTQILSNPLFTTISGGTLGAGFTIVAGSGAYAASGVPASWTVSRISGGSGAQTGNITVGANPEGPGNEVILALTSTAAGDGFRLQQDAPVGDWDFGTVAEGISSAAVDAGSTNFAGVADLLRMGFNSSTYNWDAMDNYQRGEIGLQTGYKQDLLTQPITAPSDKGAKSAITKQVQMVFAGAGTATVRIRTAGIRKRLAA